MTTNFSQMLNQYFGYLPSELRTALATDLTNYEVGESSIFVYRPGSGVQVGNIHSDWATLVSALSATSGWKVLYFDNSFSPTITIPEGTWDMHEVQWTSRVNGSSVFTTVVLPEGCVITRLRQISGWFALTSTATATPNMSDWGDTTAGRVLSIGRMTTMGLPRLISTGTAPMISVSSGQVCDINFDFVVFDGSASGPLISVAAGATLNMFARNFGTINDDAIASAVGGTVNFNSDTPSGAHPGANALTLLLGTTTINTNDRFRYRVNPLPPTAASATAIASGSVRANDILRLAPTAPITQVVPTATATNTPTWGRHFAIVNMGTALITVNPQGSETIDGFSSGSGAIVIPPGQARVFVSDGISNWMTLGDYGSALASSREISPSALASGATQDYAPAGLDTKTEVLRLTGDGGGSALGGLTGGYPGRKLLVFNIGGGVITLNDADAGSAAANQFAFNANIAIPVDGGVVLWYDGTSALWRCAGQAI